MIDEVLLKTISLFLLVTLSAFIALPLSILILTGGFLSFEIGYYRFLGLFPIGAGLVVAFWTAVSLALIGRGTPAPFDPTRNLVKAGPFKYTRNPMYLGAVTALFGETIILQSFAILFLAIAMWIFFHFFIVCFEEPGLKKKFGKSYEEYIQVVPRWLPRFKK